MTELNDKEKREELIRRYLNAETTIEEERLLMEYYIHTEDGLTPEEEELRLVIFLTNRHAVDVELCEEKEAEFDKMMAGKTVGQESHKILPFVLWPSSMAVALILAIFLMKETIKDAPVSQQYAKITITMSPCSKQTSIKDRLQQEEKGAESQLAIEVDGATLKPSTLADDKEMQETNKSIREENKQVTTTIEPSETERPNTYETFSTTTVNDTEDKRYPLNVTAANYGGEHKVSNHFVPTGNITITTKTRPNTKATHYAFANTGNGVRMVYTEMQDDSVIYMMDGKRVTKETANQIAPDSVIEMRRLKRGTPDAIKATPEGQTYDIILITTKRSDDKVQNHSLIPRRNGLMLSDNDKINGICLL